MPCLWTGTNWKGANDVKKAKWSLNPKEVASGWVGFSSGKSGQFSRRLKITSCTVTLTHGPTGLQVQGEVPPGHYSKKEMQRLRDEQYVKLFLLLEATVRKHLRKG